MEEKTFRMKVVEELFMGQIFYFSMLFSIGLTTLRDKTKTVNRPEFRLCIVMYSSINSYLPNTFKAYRSLLLSQIKRKLPSI
jgi:hypothetical protein